MKHRMGIIAALGLLASGLWWRSQVHHDIWRHRPGEAWVDANHLRVQVKGVWEDVRLMPLSDHLCHSGQPLFQRYCNDPSSSNH